MDTTKKSIHLKFSESLLNKMTDLQKFHDMNRTAVIITAINKLHEKMLKLKFGYKGSLSNNKKAAKELQEEKEAALLAMSNEELTDELIKIGYSPANTAMDGNSNLIVTYQVDDFQGARWYMQHIYDKTQGGKITSSATLMSMGELISDLKKKKLS